MLSSAPALGATMGVGRGRRGGWTEGGLLYLLFNPMPKPAAGVGRTAIDPARL